MKQKAGTGWQRPLPVRFLRSRKSYEIPRRDAGPLAFLAQRSAMRERLEEELRDHLQLRADDLERSGMSRTDAERQARLEFGGFDTIRKRRMKRGPALGGNAFVGVPFGHVGC